MSNPAPAELQSRLAQFAQYRKAHLSGDEKGEAQVFLDRLFKALGHSGVFEAGATLEMRVARHDQGGTAFADLVWKPRALIEMKRAGADLRRHYRQAFEYWIDLVPDRPKHVILCNFDALWIYDLNQQLDEPVDTVQLEELPRRWEALSFLLPIEEQPVFRNDLVAVTRDAAARVAAVFNRLTGRGLPRDQAQRFVLQAVMALFAEDVGLMPRHYFTRTIEDSLNGGSSFDLIFGLFREMNAEGETPAGRYVGTPYFNGGLFRRITAFELDRDELEMMYSVARFDWTAVRPSIFGTLFEQSLGRDERHAYGAHFTSETDIQKIVLPTIVRPWRERIDAASTLKELGDVERDLLRLRVLDPACGCGNFLYVAYRELRRLEKALLDKMRGRRRRRVAGGQEEFAFVSPAQFYGIDIRPFAVEIAKVTLMLGRKLAADELGDEHRVLPLDDLDGSFAAADALEVDWPAFDVCIGNPPYLGRRRLIEERGAQYSAWLAERYPEVGGVSDYVVYWFRKAHDLLPHGHRAGLVGTNTIRQGDSRKASLDYIVDNGGVIYDAIASQPWSGDAAVSVSIVNWCKGVDVSPKTLWMNNGSLKLELDQITGALSPEVDLRRAVDLRVNMDPKVCYQGQTPGHRAFVLEGDQATRLGKSDGRSSSVLHPYLVGDELLHGGALDRYVIDFGSPDVMTARSLAPAALDWVRENVLPKRRVMALREDTRNADVLSRNQEARVNWHHRNFLNGWWQLSYRRADMLAAISQIPRYIALSRVASEHRLPVCAFVASNIRPGDAVQVFAMDDDYSFGILQSMIHVVWFRERCSTLEDRFRYTERTVFNSFPWPQAPSEQTVRNVVDAVEALLAFREERIGRGITLGDQYDSLREPGRNPLQGLHRQLDSVVFDAYGFETGEDLLAQLLALNETLGEQERTGITRPVGPGGGELPGARRTGYMLNVVGA